MPSFETSFVKRLFCLLLLVCFTLPANTHLAQSPKKPKQTKKSTKTKPRKEEKRISVNDIIDQILSEKSPLSTKEVIQRISKSLVLVEASNDNGTIINRGSGFFFGNEIENSNKFVMTSFHVLARTTQIKVKVLDSGLIYKVGTVLIPDLVSDICFLYLENTEKERFQDLKLATMPPAVGDEIIVGGNPKGLEATYSKGIVSAIRKAENLIQIDAAISAGSSGSPVVNIYGELIGVVKSTLRGGQNLNFAVDIRQLSNPSSNPDDLSLMALRLMVLRLRSKSEIITTTMAGRLALTDVEYRNLNGNVRFIEETCVSYKKEYYVADLQVRSRYVEEECNYIGQRTFDEKGREIRFEVGGIKDSKFIKSEYGTDGFLALQEGTLLFDKDNKLSETPLTRKYDSKDASIQVIYLRRIFGETLKFANGGLWAYDDYGNIGEFIEKKGNDTRRWVSKYDSNQNIIEEKFYVNGVLKASSRFEHKFDEYGNWIERLEFTYFVELSDSGYQLKEKRVRKILYF